MVRARMIGEWMIVIWAVRDGGRLAHVRSRVGGRVWQTLPLIEGSVGIGEKSRCMMERRDAYIGPNWLQCHCNPVSDGGEVRSQIGTLGDPIEGWCRV